MNLAKNLQNITWSLARLLATSVLLIPTSTAANDETKSRSVAAAQGTIITEANGTRKQIRFPGWPTDDYSQYASHSATNRIPPLKIVRTPTQIPKGDPQQGSLIWLKAACVNCHALPGAPIKDERWAGNLGPSLAGYGARKVPEGRTYQVIYDPRAINPHTIMPAWGTAGILSAQEISHLVAFLNSLQGTENAAIDANHDPATRALPTAYFGDNLDPTRNPAALLAELGETLWNKVGPRKKSCADCHGSDIDKAMRGKATSYPRYVKNYRRVMSIEDLLAWHGEQTTGMPLLAESEENLQLAMLIKGKSNGLPVEIDLKDKNNHAAWVRGRNLFYKRIGQRNHACSDCHAQEQVKEKWLGGRYIARADASLGLTNTYPAWRTSFGQTWGFRRRVQWCMLPHGANNLAATAVEYAEMELYLAALGNGKEINVPGLKD